MSANIGEIEDMLQSTTGLLREADLENGVANARANEILARYERGEGIFAQDTWEVPALPEGAQPVLITRPAVDGKKQKGKYFN